MAIGSRKSEDKPDKLEIVVTSSCLPGYNFAASAEGRDDSHK
jgi:hypothetical protein